MTVQSTCPEVLLQGFQSVSSTVSFCTLVTVGWGWGGRAGRGTETCNTNAKRGEEGVTANLSLSGGCVFGLNLWGDPCKPLRKKS